MEGKCVQKRFGRVSALFTVGLLLHSLSFLSSVNKFEPILGRKQAKLVNKDKGIKLSEFNGDRMEKPLFSFQRFIINCEHAVQQKTKDDCS